MPNPARDAKQTPLDIGDGLSERVFFVAERRVLFEEALEVLLVRGGVIAGQQNGAAGEAGFHGVEGRLGFTRIGGWAGGQLGLRWFAAIFASVVMERAPRKMEMAQGSGKPP